MSAPTADRNLLFGILALQIDFIKKDALIQAMQAWVFDKCKPLSEVLVTQKALCPERRLLLDALVEEHVRQHDNDAQKSLAALSSIGSAKEDLEQIADADVQSSLVQVAAARADDAFATRAPLVGESTSAGVRFRILRPHAKGGLGEVFVAEDSELHREVAVKEIQGRHADNASSRARFVLEAEVTGGLEHPGIVPVYGLGQYADGRPFYAMRFIRGDSLKEAIERYHKEAASKRDAGERAVEFRKLLGRFIDVCNAIQYAHSRGVLHRDLKPGNIMLGNYGETLVVDWGLAKVVGGEEDPQSPEPPLRPVSASSSEETLAGAAVGTPQFMSPEQAAGRIDQLGPASDVYSLGATLYVLLTGKPAFTETDVGSVLHKVQRGDFPSLRQIQRDVAKPLEAICLKAMALEPVDRYESPRALADDVENWLADEPVTAYAEPVSLRTARWARRNRTLVTAASVLLVTVVAALTVGLVLLGQKQAEVVRERNAARQARDRAEAISHFYEDNVLAAARPKGWEGGVGKDVTLKGALDQAAPRIDEAFAGQPELQATVRDTLGMTYYYLGQFEAARPHLEKAYEIRRQTIGLDHPDTLTSLHNLAMQRWKQDKVKEAVPLARQALEGRRRVLGPEHQDTLWTQLWLGLLLSQTIDLDAAERTLTEAIESSKRVLGPYHRYTLHGQHDLAVVLKKKGKIDEAVTLFRQTIDARRHALGDDHPDTLRSMGSLCYPLEYAGKLDEATALCRRAWEGRRRVLGDEHMETLWSESHLGSLLSQQGEYPEAEKLLRHCLAAQRRTLAPAHLDQADALTPLGDVLTNAGRPTEAEPFLRECLAIQEKQLPPGHWETASTRSSLGSCLTRQKKYAEAEPLVVAGYEVLARARDAPASRLALALDRIIELYEKWGKPGQADLWRKKHPGS